MKINQPVTGVNREVMEDDNILSTTDLKGAITYINPDFLEISGFTEDELIGKNHNIIRHPDMPPAAFESLWSEVKNGKPWMGIVKNRCKNGDHYWVDAFVMPIKKDGETIEYQSVRYKPLPEYVNRAEKLYKKLSEGQPVKTKIWSKLKLSHKLMLSNLAALLPVALSTQLESLNQYSAYALLATICLIIGFNHILTKPFGAIIAKAKSIFDHPLMTKIYTGREDEFGDLELAMKMQSSQLDAVLGRLTDTTRILSEVAKITANTSSETSVGVDRQQSEISQVATAMTEMTSTVQEIAHNASNTAETTSESMKETLTGKQIVDEAVSSINNLASDISNASGVIDQLSRYSSNIGEILNVIKSISEQTNLLALNAAIEASRAGEHGRGFAVVADEVRTLASRTQDSTLEIEDVIEQLQSASNNAVEVIEKSLDKATASAELATKAGTTFEDIIKSIHAITDMNHQIATASEQQSVVADEINQNIVSINTIAAKTAEGAQYSSSITENIVDEINRLDALVTQFA